METGLSASDVALMSGNGMGNGGFFWIFALLVLANGGFGGWGRNGLGDYTSAQTQEILFGQQFQNLDNKMDRLGNGIADSTFALNNSIKDGNSMVAGRVVDEGRATQKNIDALRFDMSNYHADTNATVVAQTQKVLDAIQQNKIESLQGRINQLELQSALCGVVRYPNAMTYNAGTSPFCNCNCNCNAI